MNTCTDIPSQQIDFVTNDPIIDFVVSWANPKPLYGVVVMFHNSQYLIGIQVLLAPTKIILLQHEAQIHFTVTHSSAASYFNAAQK